MIARNSPTVKMSTTVRCYPRVATQGLIPPFLPLFLLGLVFRPKLSYRLYYDSTLYHSAPHGFHEFAQFWMLRFSPNIRLPFVLQHDHPFLYAKPRFLWSFHLPCSAACIPGGG